MPEYISTFNAEFEQIVARRIARELAGARVIKTYGGLLHYEYGGHPADISRVPFFNNSFAVILTFAGKDAAFDRMAAAAARARFGAVGGGSFRVRFSLHNRFVAAPGSAAALAERAVIKNCGLKPDRVNPDTEFWFILRSEGVGFFGQLLKKRGVTEKSLRKGELRPELAYLLCCCVDIPPGRVICDPFAGYGSIPLQMQQHFDFRKMFVSDIDERCVGYLRTTALGRGPDIEITRADATHLAHMADNSVDFIITDPPWGLYNRAENIAGLYESVLTEFKRVLADGGTVTLLSGAPADMAAAAGKAGFTVAERFNVLVNGKKADVMVFTRC